MTGLTSNTESTEKTARETDTVDQFTSLPTHLAPTSLSRVNVFRNILGKRYLYFPEKNDCCYCCDAAHGCGVLKPDWHSDAEFVEYVSSANGQQLEKWSKKGV
jgi:hypothetical protein